jgi:hypothetical protein
VELDVKPNWVKAVIKGKPLYLALDYEVRAEEGEAKRCQSTGKLQLVMPLARPQEAMLSNPLLRSKPAMQQSFTGYVVGENDKQLESTKSQVLDVFEEQTLADRLRFVDEQAAKQKQKTLIKSAKQLRQQSKVVEGNFEDDPNVPPLE